MTVKAEAIKLFAISRGYKQQYITSHMSATSFVHKLLNIYIFYVYIYIYISVRETLWGIKYLSNNSQPD